MGNIEAIYLVGYSFEYFIQFATDCKDVVKFSIINMSRKPNWSKIKLHNLPALVKITATQWGSLQASFENLQKFETILYGLVCKRDIISDTAAQKVEQWKVKGISKHRDLQNLLVDFLVIKYQLDVYSISIVVPDFH